MNKTKKSRVCDPEFFCCKRMLAHVFNKYDELRTNRASSPRGKTSVYVLSTLIFLLSASSISYPQDNSNSKLSAEQEQLLNAQRSNQEAQAEYYRTQTAKLNEPISQKTLLNNLAQNPAFWGGLIAAMVAVLSLVLNYRSTLQNQRDTQFYEAVKSFGDKDSSIMRSSAAGLLAQMGGRKSLFSNRRPYLDTALYQLLDGLRLEQNTLLFWSITNAIWELVLSLKAEVLRALQSSNRALQADLMQALAEFAAARGAESLDDSNESIWQEAASVTAYTINSIRGLVGAFPQKLWDQSRLDKKNLSLLFDQASQTFRLLSAERKEEYSMTAYSNLRLTAGRMRTNIALLSGALRYWGVSRFLSLHIWRSLMHTRFFVRVFVNFAHPEEFELLFVPRAFLTNAPLMGARLPEAQMQQALLRRANLQFADLHQAELQGAILQEADLRDTDLHDANLGDAELWHARINYKTNLDGANWWAANFYENSKKESVDLQLIEEILKRYRDRIPQDEPLHESVRQHLVDHQS